jgi:hypothetical protein
MVGLVELVIYRYVGCAAQGLHYGVRLAHWKGYVVWFWFWLLEIGSPLVAGFQLSM